MCWVLEFVGSWPVHVRRPGHVTPRSSLSQNAYCKGLREALGSGHPVMHTALALPGLILVLCVAAGMA